MNYGNGFFYLTEIGDSGQVFKKNFKHLPFYRIYVPYQEKQDKMCLLTENRFSQPFHLQKILQS